MVVALAVAAVLAAVGSGGAAAGDPRQPQDPSYVNTGGGLDGGPVVRTAAEQALYEQKARLARQYAAVRAGTLGYATYEADLDAFLSKTGATSSASKAAVTASAEVLSLAVRTQKETYYCGPATAAEILGYLGVSSGPHGEGLTQGHLAGRCEAGYLCTDHLEQTPWYYHSGYPHPMRTTLNEWWGIDYYVVEKDTDLWVDDMIWSISGMGNPIAANTYERANTGYHLVGHPVGSTIGHWVAVHGYKNGGSTTRYADSVYGTTFWSWSDKVPGHSDFISARFGWLMSNNSKGYVW